MTYLNELMEEQNLTREDLCHVTGIPESTLRHILNGESQIDHCEAGTLICLAEALDTTVEDIVENYWLEILENEKPGKTIVHDNGSYMDFYMNVVGAIVRYSWASSLNYLAAIRDSHWIEQYANCGSYRSALFLLGLSDYICRKNNLEIDSRYDYLRKLILDRPLYSLRIMEKCDTAQALDRAKSRARTDAIPELARFNIFMTEKDIKAMV